MMLFTVATSSLVAPLPAAHGRAVASTAVVGHPAVARSAQPVMILPPTIRGAVIGGAAVGLVKTLLDRKGASPAKVGDGDVTEAEVVAAQKLWADSIASISKVYAEKGDFVAAAGEAAGKLYGYGHGNVLFKPTKATDNPFRPTAEDAMSYFVGAEAMNNSEL